MNVLIFNGSPRRNGNTHNALKDIEKSIAADSAAKIEFVDCADVKLSACSNCNACQSNGGKCIMPDDSDALMQKLADADVLVLGTPVYWWGMSAQTKMFVDKFYSKQELFHTLKKKVMILVDGGDNFDNPEFKLISDQLHCICDYLGWDIVFDYAVDTSEKPYAQQPASVAAAAAAGEKLK